MAPSEVDVVSSSSFGCVLRDRNNREACRESNVKGTHNDHATLQRNIKNFVMDLNTCMGVSSVSTTNENENNNNTTTTTTSSSSKNKGVNQRKAPKNNRLERLRFTRANSFNNGGSSSNNKESSLALLISPRHSRLLDRWAARQAREMVSNLANEVELLSMDEGDMFPRTPSSSEEESTSSEIPNMAASSLVQIWEKRLKQSVVSKTNTLAEKIGSSSSPTNEHVNASLPEEECFDGPSGNEESSFPEWESSDHSVSPHARSESGVSVASLIKKLTSTGQSQSPTPSFLDDNEHEGYASSSVTSSPCRERECGQQQQPPSDHKLVCPLRIRGRQAFNDLLMQMEKDRHRELNNLAERGAVSKFAQRGRIQALLRIKLLQRDMADSHRSHQKSTLCELNNRQTQGSAIMQLRERFTSGVELRTTVQAEVANPRSPQREEVNKTTQLGNSATTDQLRKDTRNQKAHGSDNLATKSTQKSVSHTRIDHNNTKEASPSSDVMVQETHPRSDAKALHNTLKETSECEATTSMIDSSINEMTDRAEESSEKNGITKSSNDETVNEKDISNPQYAESSYKEKIEEAIDQNYAESSYGDEMEEEEIDQNCDDETNYDWISEISRPRSYWEERRQAWYREMLETGSQNEDIKRLLERRTVSSFLSSDFRDKMDRLMVSHRGTQAHLVNSQDHEENSQELMAFLQERLHSARTSQEEGREATEEEEEEEKRSHTEEEEEEDNADEHEEENEHEEESLISDSYHEAADRSSSWSYRDNEAGDDFDRVVSTSPQPYQSQPFYQDSRQSPSTNHHSMEMELIYDLRGHMEQLYHEMSELRKTIKGCMNMQIELQQNMKHEVHSVKKEEKKCRNRTPKKGNCCICYEVKVDTVLYRCGHMCACLKCAIELQCNSGKCPICRAKIVDVVRVYVDG